MCDVEVLIVDLDVGDMITLREADLRVERRVISFSSELLTQNRHFNISITAFNTAGSHTSHTAISV